MEISLPIVGAVSLLGVVPALRQLKREVRETTLSPAWNWALAFWLFWELAWICSLASLPVAVLDYLWYSVALLGLCPPMTVLGAKRPGARVWTVFVVLPLLLVFSWPAVVGWVHGFPPERLTLETPMLLGYVLVLIMGYGNYLGTRHSVTALMIAVSLAWLAWQFGDTPAADESHHPIGPTAIFVIACIIPTLLPKAAEEDLAGEDRVWKDFQDTFGIVWAKRILDRINHTAQEENWSARLEAQGFVWNENTTQGDKEQTRSRIDHTLRWHLRRFVDPPWIEERILHASWVSSKEPRTK